MQDIQEALVSLFVAVVTGSIGLVAIYIQKYLSEAIAKVKAESDKIEDDMLRDNVEYAIDTIEKIIHDTVYSLQVSMVKDIKKASADGKLTKEEALGIYKIARNEILNQIPEELQLLASHSIKNIGAFINVKIEEQLEKVKQELEE